MVLQNFLQCIHHFASHFYAERGQINHVGNEARAERRARKRRRDAHNGGENKEEEVGDLFAKRGKAAHSSAQLTRTMYRQMDGSALTVLGDFASICLAFLLMHYALSAMLLQEHIAQLVNCDIEDENTSLRKDVETDIVGNIIVNAEEGEAIGSTRNAEEGETDNDDASIRNLIEDYEVLLENTSVEEGIELGSTQTDSIASNEESDS